MSISLLQFAQQSQQPMMAGLIEIITAKSLFLKLLKFIAVDGFTYEYNQRLALPGIQFRGINTNYSTPPSVIAPQVESLRIFGGEVQTDAIIYDIQGDRARQNEITGKVLNAGLFYDNCVINGDPGTLLGSFPGLKSRITGNQLMLAGTNGGALTLAMIDFVIDQCIGGEAGKVIVCNKAVRRNITNLARGTAKVTTLEAATGQVLAYNGIPIMVLDEDDYAQPIIAENETCGTSNVTTSLYVLKIGGDVDGEYVQGLIGTDPMIKMRDVGLLGTYYLDVIDMFAGFGIFHPRAGTRLAGILPQ
jgi:hypothetical protein